MRHLTRQKVLRLITAMMVFITGILLGSVLTITIVWHRIDTLADLPKVEAHQRIWRRQLDRNLDLNSQEREGVERILQQHTHEHETILKSSEAQLKRFRQGIYPEIESTLRDKNKAAFWTFVKRYEERQKKRF